MLKQFRVPHTLVLLFGMMVVALITTYILPHGAFEMLKNDHGRMVVVPGSFALLETTHWLSPLSLFTVLPRALADTQGIIFFVFIIGGALAVIRATGTIDAFLGMMLERFGGKTQMLVAAGLFIFAAGSSTIGMAEEYLPFVAPLLAFCIALKLDAVVAVAIIVVGYGVGYGCAAINPFTVIVAQEIAGLKPTSGMWYRLVLFVPFFIVGWLHLRKYVAKHKGETETDATSPLDTQTKEKRSYPSMTPIHWIILSLMMASILLFVYGVSELSGWHWYLTELSAVFFALALLTAIIARMKPDEAAKAFVIGATELTSTILLIGFARSVALILEDGQVLHTIIYYVSLPLQKTGPELASIGMYLTQSVFNFFIPSGSGQAYVTMPLMAPIADLTGVTRQTAVLAYQFGDGFTNMIVPTNAVLMGILGIAGVPYERWFKFIFPLIVKFWILGSIAMLGAVWMGYQ